MAENINCMTLAKKIIQSVNQEQTQIIRDSQTGLITKVKKKINGKFKEVENELVETLNILESEANSGLTKGEDAYEVISEKNFWSGLLDDVTEEDQSSNFSNFDKFGRMMQAQLALGHIRQSFTFTTPISDEDMFEFYNEAFAVFAKFILGPEIPYENSISQKEIENLRKIQKDFILEKHGNDFPDTANGDDPMGYWNKTRNY